MDVFNKIQTQKHDLECQGKEPTAVYLDAEHYAEVNKKQREMVRLGPAETGVKLDNIDGLSVRMNTHVDGVLVVPEWYERIIESV